MQAVCVKRDALKTYTPKFTAASIDKNKSFMNVDNKGVLKTFTDRELMSLIKLLHTVYVES